MVLTELQTAAALADQAYRRANTDQQISDIDIGVSGMSTLNIANLAQDGTSAFYYNGATGFVGHVVQTSDTIYVVFRGSDMAGGLASLAGAQVGYSNMAGVIDTNDFAYGNLPLASGTSSSGTQFDDALALAQAAVAQAGNRRVVVVGQSLGGGLAGLVSATLNLDSYLIASAPFQNELEILELLPV